MSGLRREAHDVNDDLAAVVVAAKALFDGRRDYTGTAVHAPRELWAALGAAFYGRDDRRVKELMDKRR